MSDNIGQISLFDDDFRSDKEIFTDFSRAFMAKYEIHLYYPEVLEGKKQGIFFKTLRNLYFSHVINGSWSEDLFEKSVMKTIESRKPLSTIYIEQNGIIIEKERENRHSIIDD